MEHSVNNSFWIKKKKTTINPVNDDDKCFQCTATVALNYKDIGKNIQRMSKIKPFINNYDWREQIVYQRKMTGKSLKKKINQQLLLICYMLKNEQISCLHFKRQLKL